MSKYEVVPEYNPDQKPINIGFLFLHEAIRDMQSHGFSVDTFKIHQRKARLTIQPVTMAVRIKFPDCILDDADKMEIIVDKVGKFFTENVDRIAAAGKKYHKDFRIKSLLKD